MRNYLKLSVLIIAVLSLCAWSWPGSKKTTTTEKNVPKASAQVTATSSASAQAPKEILPAEESTKSGEPAPGRPVVSLPPLQKTPAPPAIHPASVSPLPSKPPLEPLAVQKELNQVMELQTRRQKELEAQMKAVQTTLERAKIYNRILNTMHPVTPILPGKSVTAAAVNQEKIRLIHEEVRRMVPPIPSVTPAVRSAQAAGRQVKQARKPAFELPIGKNAPQTGTPQTPSEENSSSSESQ